MMTSSTNNSDLWIEKYRPKKSSDLACHSSKIKAITQWINSAFCQNSENEIIDVRPKLLAVVGCSGNGKGTMVDLLCQELKVETVKWTFDNWQTTSSSLDHNHYSSNVYEKEHRFFEESSKKLLELDGFILRSAYPSLSISSSSSSSSTNKYKNRNSTLKFNNNLTTTSTTNKDSKSTNMGVSRKVIVIEDPPHVIGAIKDSNMFLERLIEFRAPVIMILSEANAKEDKLYTIQTQLPPKITEKLNFVNLFCPQITPLKVKKVLDNIASHENLSPRTVPSLPDIIHDISDSCMGDLRHAIIKFQFVTSNLISKNKSSWGNKNKTNSFGERFASDSNKTYKGGKSSSSHHRFDGKKREKEEKEEKKEEEDDDVVASSKSSNNYRDTSISSLHSVSKLLASRLDRFGKINIDCDLVIDTSEFPEDIMISFLQSNSMIHLQRAAKLSTAVNKIKANQDKSNVHTINKTTVETEDDEVIDNIIPEHDDPDNVALFQISAVFDDFSDVDILWDRTYDSSYQIDHSDSIFPLEYCKSISSRCCAVAKGLGEYETQEKAKALGFKLPPALANRPKSLDIWRQISSQSAQFLSLRKQFADRSFSSTFINLAELSLVIVPYLKYLKTQLPNNIPFHLSNGGGLNGAEIHTHKKNSQNGAPVVSQPIDVVDVFEEITEFED